MGEAVGGTHDADVMLFGRVTYDSFAGAWPEREAAGGDDAEFAKQLGDMRKIVASRSPLELTWRNSEQLDGDLVEAVTALKADPSIRQIALSGSTSVVRQLLDAGLLDELHLFVHPATAGVGLRLFDDDTPVRPPAAAVGHARSRPASSTSSTPPTRTRRPATTTPPRTTSPRTDRRLATRPPGMAWDLLVDRSDLSHTELVEVPTPDPRTGPGRAAVRPGRDDRQQRHLRRLRRGHAVLGLLPRPRIAAFGRVPLWGFAEVEASTVPEVAEGTRLYGYLPTSSHLVVQPSKADAKGFRDASPHRQHLPTPYNGLITTAEDPAYVADQEDLQVLYRPLFMTSFVLADFITDHDCFGAPTVVISSASSKTSYGTAFLLDGLHRVGLTSAGNRDFTESLGCYDEVRTYDEVEELTEGPAVYVDVAGDPALRRRVHERLGPVHSAVVGAAHHDAAPDLGGGDDLPGSPPDVLLRARPDAQALRRLGSRRRRARHAEAWARFAPVVAGWVDVTVGAARPASTRRGRRSSPGRPRRGSATSSCSPTDAARQAADVDLSALSWPITTARLSLRPATLDDAATTWPFRQLPSVGEWLTRAPTTFAQHEAQFTDPVALAKTVIVEHDGEVVGDLMLAVADAWAQAEVSEDAVGVQAELGWVISPEHARRGFGIEAARELLRICFQDLGLRRVSAGVLRGQRGVLAAHGGPRHAARAALGPGLAPPVRPLAGRLHLRPAGGGVEPVTARRVRGVPRTLVGWTSRSAARSGSGGVRPPGTSSPSPTSRARRSRRPRHSSPTAGG